MAAFTSRAPVVRCSGIRAPLAQPVVRHQRLLPRCLASATAQAVQEATPSSSTLQVESGKVCLFNAPDFDRLNEVAGSRLVVVDVYTTWCGPCKMIAPELEKMALELGDKMIMSKIDCTSNNDNKKWAMTQSVKALPTFILFKDGKRVNDMTGAKANNLRKLIDAHM